MDFSFWEETVSKIRNIGLLFRDKDRNEELPIPSQGDLSTKPFIEFHREPYSDEFTLIDREGRKFEYSPAEEKFTLSVAMKHGINLSELELDRLLDALWGYGIVLYWSESNTWEIL